MKKLFLLFALGLSTATFAQRRSANTSTGYSTALGLTIDAGNGATLVGPSIKHFFDANNAGQAELTFGGDATYLAAFYQYHAPIDGAPGLKWYLGGGPQLGFSHGNTAFYLRPMAGLDYKIAPAPISLTFDWRPSWYIGDYGNNFEAGRFGIGFRFTF